MALIPIRSDNAYFGLGMQSVQGTAVAPTSFPRWLDGSSIEWDMKTEEVWEGDGTRHLSQLWKNGQSVKFKLVFNPRPIEAGLIEKALNGANSDTPTAAVLATTTTTTITAGTSTTVTLSSVTGLPGSGTVAIALDPGLPTEEIGIFSLPPSGSVLTLVASYNNGTGKFAQSHTSGAVARTSTAHVFVDKFDGDYWTIEVGLGNLGGAAGPTLRCRDCKLESVKVSGKAGSLITYETEWNGIATVSTGLPATVTLEMHSPFFYTSGTWTLNGSTTGDALNVESFDLTRKNNLDTGIQTEQLTLAALIFGNLSVDVSLGIVFQNAQLLNLTYFGSTTGTTDAQPIGAGSLLLLFTQPDTFHTLQYNVATMHYSKTKPPEPKKDGKHYMLDIAATGVSNQGASAYICQATVTNTQTAAY